MTVSKVEQTRISLSWEVSQTCFESVDFTVNISWNPCSGEEQVTNVSGSSYDITGLTPGVRYNITLVAIVNGIRSDSISISATTLSSGEGTVHAHCLRQRQAGLVVDTQVWCKLGMVDVVIHCTSGCGYCIRISLQ